MAKRSLFVLALLILGAFIGVLSTGWLTTHQPVPSVDASSTVVTDTRPVADPAEPQEAPARAQEPPPPPAPPAGAGLRIGVVNLMQCFLEEKYAKAKDVTDEIKKLIDENKKRRDSLAQEIRDVKDQMAALAASRGGALYQEKWRKLKMLETQDELDKEMGEIKFRTEYSRLKLEVYNEIRRVIDIYGRENKYDLILRVEEPQLEDESPVTVSQQINQRVVLYNTEALDVTKDVLALLNAEYAKAKKK